MSEQTVATPHRILFPLETLTPLFLGGADPRGQPELRATAVRGALRFWLRALLGGCYGTDDAALAEIRRVEAETFGEAGGESKAGASKIVVRVAGRSTKIERFDTSLVEMKYLLFGMQQSGKSQLSRMYFAPGSTFTLELAERFGVPRDISGTAWQKALIATWLLIHLGGLGARSRRAAGSIGVEFRPTRLPDGSVGYRPMSINKLPLHLLPELNSAAQQVGQNLSEIRAKFGVSAEFSTSLPRWEILHPSYCFIWLVSFNGERSTSSSGMVSPATAKEDQPWKVALRCFQQFLLDTREAFELHDRIVLGAPLKATPVAKVRRPSPLCFSVTQTVKRQLIGVVTLFKSQLYSDIGLVKIEKLEDLHKIVAESLYKNFSNVAEVHYA